MCQQWFSVVGLILDIVGFSLIAFEWHHVFQREHERRIFELQHDDERHSAELQGEAYEDPRHGDYTLWREFQRLFLKEWAYRRRLFYMSILFVILGFLGQEFGSWPTHLTFLGLRSC
jgi:hypothetical protein